MGPFDESSWGVEKSVEHLDKRLAQKRKEKERKRKSNILNSKTNDPKTKKKKKKNKNKTHFQSFNETQEKYSPQNVQKVQNSQNQSKKKSLQNKLTNSSKSSKSVKMRENFSKTKFNSKKKLEMVQSTESLKKKSFQDQEIISQSSITPLKVKKRKRPEFEEVEQVTKSKKRKKSRPETNKIQNCQIQKTEKVKNIISVGTLEILKNKKKKKIQNVKIQIDGNLKYPQRQKDDLVKRISIKKIQEMIKNKKQEVNERKLDSSSLRERMLAHLRSSRFRFINESLYSSESSESKEYFKEDPEAFIAYHEGYRQQVAHWPLNPVDVIIASVKKMPKDYIIADFGCGEAKLADSVSQTVHSFDLMAMNDKVKACDMSHTSLLRNGVNVVVFCLSLMGTNLADYLLEANRVLKTGGIMKIAEVESRFDSIENFINLVSLYGFVNIWMDFSNDLFYFLDFKKEKDVSKGKKKLPVIELKPCLYKKR